MQQAVLLTLQFSILMTVFGFGLQTSPGDVLYVVRRPSLLGRSLLAIFVIMPIVAVALARAFDLRPPVEIALVTLSLSPIPPLLPGREDRAGGHQSYALGLMAIAGLVAIVTVPASVQLLGGFFMLPFALSPGVIVKIVFTTALLPLAAGMTFRAALPAVALRIVKAVVGVSQVLLVIGVLAIVAGTMRAALALAGNGTRRQRRLAASSSAAPTSAKRS
jgi:BASS family bile acid:Na+ symporter